MINNTLDKYVAVAAYLRLHKHLTEEYQHNPINVLQKLSQALREPEEELSSYLVNYMEGANYTPKEYEELMSAGVVTTAKMSDHQFEEWMKKFA